MPKTGYLLLIICIHSLHGFCQVTAIQLNWVNRLYVGIANPLTVAVENHPSSSIILTTDNGYITLDSSGRGPGHYVIWPKTVGHAEVIIKIKTRKGLKVIDSMYFNVKHLSADVSLGGKKGGDISGNAMAKQIAPGAFFDYSEAQICGRFQIDSMTVIVIRKDKEIFRKSIQTATGVRFDSEMTSAFYRLLKGDKVLITNMTIRDFDYTHRRLEPLEFTIVESTTIIPENDSDRIVIDPITGMEVIMKK